MFTLIEGEWDEVFDVVKRATEAVSSVSPRTSLVVKADIRPGFDHQLTEKVDAVNRRLESSSEKWTADGRSVAPRSSVRRDRQEYSDDTEQLGILTERDTRQ